ncbi:LOW QUALITY PROTEIN: ubiquitin-like modifier-activating enzyme 6 [Amphiura filiformis]|uniref:LOW QUALITY PROTEIN: ubiquitin-like modifier-activating enzyme 6 n=1 Tax=Amphiura filiformis TaxID=82378 RepID=UPI003B21E471
MATEKEEIDDSLYSRQRYVLGDSAMKQMAHSNVFLSGLGGLGVEIAKNVVLAGVRSLTVHDTKTATFKDLGTQFFLREEDVKASKNRAEASVSRLSELNPYVTVKSSTQELTADTDLTFLSEFKCVIITEAPLSLQQKLDEYCRSQEPPIKFIMADVYGVHSYAFCDFGDEFTIMDPNGEEPKESFIATITKENPGVVTSLDNRMHGFQDGDSVSFKEVQGMTALNGTTRPIKVLSPYAYTIGDLSGDEFQPHETGGIATQVKMPKPATFKSLAVQLKSPCTRLVDFTKDPNASHLAMCALLQYIDEHKQLPAVRSSEDAQKLIAIATKLNQELENAIEPLNNDMITNLAYTSQGSFVPLTAAMGGIVAQEVLKALTGKFTPLNQWLFLDAVEILGSQDSIPAESFQPRGDRYDSLRICVGDEMVQKLANLRLFMVGCGAIGCEMMKNYALLGIASTDKGKITITDNDLIEKSNLNRQFLFRPHHIQKPKSETAAASTKEINPALHIEPHQNKVCPDTEQSHYNDAFFQRNDVIVNALDNVEARRYMDSRCVTNKKPLMESGTLGAKGHVQVIVPDLTETYSNQQDPPEESVPYCTLKSFPATIEHTIQWARDKFENMFNMKPNMFNKYWSTNGSPQQALERMQNGLQPENTFQTLKLLKNRPGTWDRCVATARIKFEKYFNHKAKQLLYSFPPDAKTSEGEPFWQSPKRPPTPVEFDSSNELHMLFVVSAARLYASFCNIRVTDEDRSSARLLAIINGTKVPKFVPSDKKIVTDESASGKENEDSSGGPSGEADDDEDDADITACIHTLQELIKAGRAEGSFLGLLPVEFEKDDDSNGHIDFITSASNLRASMYSIEHADRFKTKRIAGRIVPAIATTTAAVSGLATLELIRYVKGAELEEYRNCFLNLGLAIMMFSEPGPATTTVIKPGLTFTQWDMWHVQGNPDFKLADFVKYFQDKHDLTVSMVVNGTKMVYVPIMPGHMKRLPQKMCDLIKFSDGIKYVDLTVGFEPEDPDEDEDLSGPPIRYHFGL